MVMSTVARIMERRQVAAIIAADPIDVVFHRREKVEVHGGGWKWGPETPLPPQTIALIPFKRRMTDFLVNTELGNVPNLPYVLLGRWDLDIRADDWFTYGSDRMEVKTIDFKTEVRIAAQVDYFGANHES